jgi:hypothetical protein
MLHEDRYNRLRGLLIIDMKKLDDEVIQLPGLMLESIECEVEAMALRDNAKNRLSFLKSQESARLREVIVIDASKKEPTPRKRTEGELNELTEISDVVQEAQGEYEEAKFEYELWRGVTEGLRTKASSLKRLNELTVCGYISPTSLHQDTRAAINATRKPIAAKE